MSASDPNSAIYVTDSAKDIKNKVWLQKLPKFYPSFSSLSGVLQMNAPLFS